MDEVLISIIPGELYNIHNKDCTLKGLGEKPTRIQSCYTTDNKYYIGDIKTADYLTKKRGLTQLQPAKPGDNICSIGFHAPTKKWFGWSHRAINGFGIDDVVKPGDCAFKPRNVQEWINERLSWHKDDDTGWGLGRVKSFTWDGDSNTLSIVKHDSPTVTEEVMEKDQLGNGEWRAANLDDARRMAIDFAASVSSTLGDFTSTSSQQTFRPLHGARLRVNRIKIQLRD